MLESSLPTLHAHYTYLQSASQWVDNSCWTLASHQLCFVYLKILSNIKIGCYILINSTFKL